MSTPSPESPRPAAAMTPRQVQLVQSTWQQVVPIRAVAADLFYARLFELAPDTRPLFKRDIHVQGAMLMATLDAVVRHIDRLDAVVPGAELLARRHVGYGVQPQHYDSVGTALIWTLEQGLGPALSAEAREAWVAAYAALAGAMKAAAYPDPQPAMPADSPPPMPVGKGPSPDPALPSQPSQPTAAAAA